MRLILRSVSLLVVLGLSGCSLVVDFDRSLLFDGGLDGGTDASVDVGSDAPVDDGDDPAPDGDADAG